ncbi:hypothetical protein FG99_19765 [Pseudomonas sp. AAC]|nr:hypothetical protein FG99_19765 [Pseudomonas sp. AAC]
MYRPSGGSPQRNSCWPVFSARTPARASMSSRTCSGRPPNQGLASSTARWDSDNIEGKVTPEGSMESGTLLPLFGRRASQHKAHRRPPPIGRKGGTGRQQDGRQIQDSRRTSPRLSLGRSTTTSTRTPTRRNAPWPTNSPSPMSATR